MQEDSLCFTLRIEYCSFVTNALAMLRVMLRMSTSLCQVMIGVSGSGNTNASASQLQALLVCLASSRAATN